MAVAEARGIWKTFGDRTVVHDVSLDVDAGQVLGLVGPNGAGKTTTIRMLLDIIRPDRGDVLLFDAPFADEHRSMLGYLPEERGLYRDLKVRETLRYLGALKGMAADDARARADEVLEQLGMAEHAGKRVKELSRGMGQLIGLAATVIHKPRLMVLDEPFAGLDPVNLRMVKERLVELGRSGVALILSTHQMDQVEELCDRIVMINGGEVVLRGQLDRIRRDFGEGSVIVEASARPDDLPGVQTVTDHGSYYELIMSDGAPTQAVFRAMAEREDLNVSRFEVAALPLEEIFVRVVQGGGS